ncbi:MAG: hypothetical protein AB9866_25030 [Syntrophobacteraceae bacterium]
MKGWKHSFWILFCLILCSCSAVYSTDPLGEKPYPVSEQDWEGTWINKDTFFSVQVIDGKNGMLKWTWIEPGDKVKLESYEMQLRQSGQLVFGNVKADDKGGRALYAWGLVKREKNGLICWIPDVDKFKSLCKKGILPCKEEEGNVILTSLTPAHLDIINSENEGVLYDWREPFVFIRTATHGR